MKKPKLKKGDSVVAINTDQAWTPERLGKIFVCQTDEFQEMGDWYVRLDDGSQVDVYYLALVKLPEIDKEAVKEALAEALGDAMDCIRVWKAWDVGTMTRNDFIEIRENEERLEEITISVIDAINKKTTA